MPQEVPAFTVNKACASGLKSIALAYQAILLGDSSCILAGGTRIHVARSLLSRGARWGYRLGNQELVDGMYRDGFFCPHGEDGDGRNRRIFGGTLQNFP